MPDIRRTAICLLTLCALATVAPATEALVGRDVAITDHDRRLVEARTGARSAAVGTLAGWETFRVEQPGSWEAQWSPATGTPSRIVGGPGLSYPGTPEQAARRFLEAHRSLLGLEEQQALDLTAEESLQGKAVLLGFRPRQLDVPIYESGVAVVLDAGGRLLAVYNDNYPQRAVDLRPGLAAAEARRLALRDLSPAAAPHVEAEPRRTIFPLAGGARLAWHMTFFTHEPFGLWEYVIDAENGDVLRRFDRARYATGVGGVYDSNPLEGPQSIRDLEYLDGTGFVRGTYANAHPLNGDRAFRDNGRFLFLFDEEDTGPPSRYFDETNLYYHVNQIHDFLLTLGPEVDTKAPDLQVEAGSHVNLLPCNAFYVGLGGQLDAIAFSDGPDSVCNNSSAEESVVYHEYGHRFFDNWVGAEGAIEGGALSESIGDQMAVLKNGDRQIGEYMFFPGLIRDMQNDRNYAQLCTFNGGQCEVHHDGEIMNGTLWQLRETLIARRGAAAGVATWNTLVYNALRLLAVTVPDTFVRYRDGLLFADDFLLGGQNVCTIWEVFASRGLGVDAQDNTAGSPDPTWSTAVPVACQ